MSIHDIGDFGSVLASRFLRHRSLQYFTWSQTFSHFFRHWNGRPQATQTFSGKFGLWWGMEITLPER